MTQIGCKMLKVRRCRVCGSALSAPNLHGVVCIPEEFGRKYASGRSVCVSVRVVVCAYVFASYCKASTHLLTCKKKHLNHPLPFPFSNLCLSPERNKKQMSRRPASIYQSSPGV